MNYMVMKSWSSYRLRSHRSIHETRATVDCRPQHAVESTWRIHTFFMLHPDCDIFPKAFNSSDRMSSIFIS
jgi:hypothetical protein